jgi:hypothetical protein
MNNQRDQKHIVKYVGSIVFDAAKGWRGIVDMYGTNRAKSLGPDVSQSQK